MSFGLIVGLLWLPVMELALPVVLLLPLLALPLPVVPLLLLLLPRPLVLPVVLVFNWETPAPELVGGLDKSGLRYEPDALLPGVPAGFAFRSGLLIEPVFDFGASCLAYEPVLAPGLASCRGKPPVLAPGFASCRGNPPELAPGFASCREVAAELVPGFSSCL